MTRLGSVLKDKNRAIGTLVSVSSPQIAEALSYTGLEWLFFDMEHSTQSHDAVQSMIQAMNPDCLSYVRVRDDSVTSIKQALDTGCDGIIVPQVNSPEQAEKVVAAALYPPEGERSVGLGRSCLYGARLADAVSGQNKILSVHAQIEHRDAVENLAEIASVKGLDGLFIGPYDLSGSFGKPGDLKAPEVQNAIQKTLETANANGLIAGIFCGTDEAAVSELERGFRFITVGADILRLCNSCSQTTRAFQ